MTESASSSDARLTQPAGSQATGSATCTCASPLSVLTRERDELIAVLNNIGAMCADVEAGNWPANAAIPEIRKVAALSLKGSPE